MIELQELFVVKYGVNLDLNKLEQVNNGINFVSRTFKNNGVSAIVKSVKGVTPISGGVLTVAGGGSVLETFLQLQPFYSGRDLYYLLPKITLTNAQKLYYCACIRANKYRYSYGRQANKTLKSILIPSVEEIPDWVNSSNLELFNKANKSASNKKKPDLNMGQWRAFRYKDIFDIRKGKRLTKAHMLNGKTPFIGAIDSNNGVSSYIAHASIFDKNTITVSYNGSVAEGFYQNQPYWASDDVNVLYPKFELNSYIAMFLIALIRKEKYRFNYGRKWHKARMQESSIKLPIDKDENPDWQFMEDYIKSLPYSSNLEYLK